MNKVKLILADCSEKVWKGLVEIDGEVFGITVWVGSATNPCEAQLRQVAWTDIEEGGTLWPAIQGALEEWNEPREASQVLTRSPKNDLLKLLEEHPEALEEIQEVLNRDQNEQ